MRINRSITLFAAACMLTAGTAATVSVLAPSTASAIPAPQEACASPNLTLTGGSGPFRPIGSPLTVNDGESNSNIVAFTSMDANVSNEGELRTGWSVDGRAVPMGFYPYGPGNIAENQQFDGARTVMDVIPLGPGTHTLQPEIRLSGAPSITGQILRMCVVAEADTQ
jgi:hypothetical protein